MLTHPVSGGAKWTKSYPSFDRIRHPFGCLLDLATDAIALKVKQEFAAKEKAKKANKPNPATAVKTKKAA